MSSSKLFQKGVVTLQDPETNVYRALAKAGDLDDKLAEVRDYFYNKFLIFNGNLTACALETLLY